tara:strand:+ start:3584 stop:3814 length:231 start_codon:yes stop_codon:yes gene_type:complete
VRDTVIEVLKSHFGNDRDINDNTHMMDDLGGDELDIIDVIVQVESALDISIPEQETFDVRLVSELLEVVGRHVQSD